MKPLDRTLSKIAANPRRVPPGARSRSGGDLALTSRFAGKDELTGVYALTDDVTDEVFEEAVTAALGSTADRWHLGMCALGASPSWTFYRIAEYSSSGISTAN